ncbi:MAG: FAD-binding protein, partial [Candidatus Thorarchaeota archaeon]
MCVITSTLSFSPDVIKNGLENIIQGEAVSSEITRYLFSTDASVYRIMPSCVVFPKNPEDVRTVLKFANSRGIPVHARGAGSGLGGAALGSGIILAMRKFMNKIIEINDEENYAIVQPGVICGKLNNELAKIGKIVYVDNSSENYASLGGMIGTNSSGAHAVKYGYMADFVEELTVILSNGEEIKTHPMEIGSPEYNEITAHNTLEAEIYKTAVSLVNNQRTRELIATNFPKVRMSVSGYNIRDLIKGNVIDLSKLFLGSEATLGIVVEAKLKLIPKPTKKSLVVIEFENLMNSGTAVEIIVREIGPAAIEILGKSVLEIGVSVDPSLKEVLPDPLPDNVLYVEFDEENPQARADKVAQVRKVILEEKRLAKDMKASDDPVEQAALWKVRKEAVPLLQILRGDPRRIMAFVEDQTVPLEHLGSYMTTLREQVFPKHGIKAAIYGHAAKGLVHTRPFVSTRDAKDLQIIEKIAEEVNTTVIGFGGSISGEHNDGFTRINFIKRLYGEEIYDIFKRIKKTADPNTILNPDKKITEKKNLLTSNLRYGANYESIPLETNLVWLEKRAFEDEIESCHGCGKCTVEFLPARDCPIYRAKIDTTEELSAPRARSN